MKYVISFLILLPSLYTLNYARYNWSKKNKSAAIGSVLLAMVSIVLPVVLMFTR